MKIIESIFCNYQYHHFYKFCRVEDKVYFNRFSKKLVLDRYMNEINKRVHLINLLIKK